VRFNQLSRHKFYYFVEVYSALLGSAFGQLEILAEYQTILRSDVLGRGTARAHFEGRMVEDQSL